MNILIKEFDEMDVLKKCDYDKNCDYDKSTYTYVLLIKV